MKQGRVRLGAWTRTAGAAHPWVHGMGMLSEDRKGEGLAGSMSIADNLTLSRLEGLGPGPLVLPRRQEAAAGTWIDRLAIRARSARQPVVELSGGNQQKVAIGRLLHHDVDVLVLDEPTRGIDVGSKAQIYALLDALSRNPHRGRAPCCSSAATCPNCSASATASLSCARGGCRPRVLRRS